MRRFILIPHLKIHNANAMSSPYSIGFPAITAWLGAMHALQRKLNAKGHDIELRRLAVSCHDFSLQTHKGQSDFVHSIIGTANPLDKDGSRPAFIEEARCHLEVSLLIEVENLGKKQREGLLTILPEIVNSMKFAGGDVLAVYDQQILDFDEDGQKDQELKPILNKLMLGHVLIERRDLVIQSMQDGQDALDAVLDHLKVKHSSQIDENGKITWSSSRKEKGWFVPIAVGFQGISELGIAKNQRDADTPHRFAEAVLTLGEFVMPYRIENIDQLLWQYHVDLENNLYLCQNLTTN
ncbi:MULTISPECIES: type I-F CRISPR-associated protein Csy2 [Acinetobacter]|uniref:Type I-F CRISPR-associated protein Csy2 n=1 Tax=Acinetobacter ursingii TaxID=108980 RepID=A0A7T9Z591_9GAMM|nr:MULTISPECIES: type I-F CRISPR-associated protein Csy2 [Acinetobacter]ENX46544.1 CRISPR type I-f/ypest-associated protein csy2 [Acinetobacter ursingii NIPH 706]EXD33124.1 CRISPR-associated family protein [Acinetobacter sp. 479375]MCH2015763.1 type I-F CRISPR-associated protein Csy2 [Acinetobacter ursingii]MCU4524293.1 type I-F CRISPR-associated protein Csy2 [Acinetobacter ursingii]MCU4589483.1 type I-F CRISPR-associated protein Csy2 [Acinetobacter ursingii]